MCEAVDVRSGPILFPYMCVCCSDTSYKPVVKAIRHRRQSRTPTARRRFTSVPRRQRASRAGPGYRPCPAKVGSRSCASTVRSNLSSLRSGGRARSNWSNSAPEDSGLARAPGSASYGRSSVLKFCPGRSVAGGVAGHCGADREVATALKSLLRRHHGRQVTAWLPRPASLMSLPP